MRKLTTLFAVAAAALCASATDYTAPMAVEALGEVTGPFLATITLEENNGAYDLTLKNFIFKSADAELPFGNVVATGLPGIIDGDEVEINATAHASITDGNLPGVDSWVGPIMFPDGLDVFVQSESDAYEMDAKIAISITGIGDVTVYFGDCIEEALGEITELSYTAPMAVEVKGALIPQGDATIIITADDDDMIDEDSDITFTLCLKNFIFDSGDGTSVPFGNITLSGMEPKEVDANTIKFDCAGTAKVTEGDKPGVKWMGKTLMPLGAKLELTAVMTIESLEATITILNAPMVGPLTVYFGEETVAKAGVENVAVENDTVVGTYDLNGIRIANPTAGKLYIQKLASGKARKAYIR